MKKNNLDYSVIIFILFLAINAFGQANKKTSNQKNKNFIIWASDTTFINKEYKDSLLKYNFSSIWTNTDNSYTYGIIGNNFQRLKIKVITATGDTLHSDTYRIYGKSMVKNNICQFTGTFKITSIRVFKNFHWGVDDKFKGKGIKKQGVLIGEYHLAEDSAQIYSGTFDGFFSTLWYIDNNEQIVYDTIEQASDNYRNNQFVGTWKGYKTTVKKKCNWGDFRVPFSDDLDIGAGFFSPADKYLQFGWLNLRNAIKNDEQAIKDELKEWWK